jgi:hypothetical protein
MNSGRRTKYLAKESRMAATAPVISTTVNAAPPSITKKTIGAAFTSPCGIAKSTPPTPNGRGGTRRAGFPSGVDAFFAGGEAG